MAANAITGSSTSAVANSSLGGGVVHIGDLALATAALELQQIDKEVAETVKRMQDRNRQREALTSAQTNIETMVSQLPPDKNEGDVTGSPRQFSVDPVTGKATKGPTLPNVYQSGWAVVHGDGSQYTPQQVTRSEQHNHLVSRDHSKDGDWGSLIGAPDPYDDDDSVDNRPFYSIDGNGNLDDDKATCTQYVDEFGLKDGKIVETWHVSRAALTDESQRLGREITNLGSQNDLDSVRLQNLMSKRSEVAQMATNVMKASDDGDRQALNKMA